MLQIIKIIKDASKYTFSLAASLYNAVYNYNKEVQDKKGVKYKERNDLDKNKAFWGKVKSFLGNVIDRLSAPSFLKICTLGSIAMLALSPFGPVAIAISASISVLCLGMGVAIDGKNLKDLRVQQKEAKGVESIMELQMDKLKTLDKSPGLKKILDDVMQKGEKQDGKDQTLRIKNVLQHFPEALIPLVGNIMTGNLISIGVGVGCMMLGGVGAYKEQKSFSKQRGEMHEIVEANKALLKSVGIDIDYPRGGGLEFLKDTIVNTENEITAIKNIQEKIEKGELTLEKPEQVKQHFIKEVENIKNIPKAGPSKADSLEVKGLNYYVKKAFLGSFSYDNSREIFAPLAHYNADNHKKLEEFYQDRQLQETIALEIDKDIGVESSVNGKQFASKSATGRNRSHHVEKLKKESIDYTSRSL